MDKERSGERMKLGNGLDAEEARTISSSVANRGCGEFFPFYKKEDWQFCWPFSRSLLGKNLSR